MLQLKTCPTRNASDGILDFIVLPKLNSQQLSGTHRYLAEPLRRVAPPGRQNLYASCRPEPAVSRRYLNRSGKNNFECCAPAGLARVIDGAVMGQDDLFDNGDAQTAATNLGGLK